MSPEPNRHRNIEIEDLRELLSKEYPVDLKELELLLDTVMLRLESAYGKIAGALPDGCSDAEREARVGNRQRQIELALQALVYEARNRHLAK